MEIFTSTETMVFETLRILLDLFKYLQYLRLTLSGFKDIGIRKFKFLAKTQFVSFDFFRLQKSIFLLELSNNRYIYYYIVMVVVFTCICERSL